MRRRPLAEKLRAILLTTPLIALPACSASSGPPVCATRAGSAYGTMVYESPTDDGGSFPDCDAACLSFYFRPRPACGGPHPLDSCAFVDLADSGPGLSCTGEYGCGGCTGRRPASLLASGPIERAHAVGAYLAEAARLEAASVPAFRLLAKELQNHRAPAQLIRRALRAARDEVRHARDTASLARRYGTAPIRPRFGAEPEGRGLEAIGLENAAEGCVRESYGALVGLWQAHHAKDPVIAAAMNAIAIDEVRHGELAWDVAAWIEPQLSRGARGRVGDARRRAFEDLSTAATLAVAPSLVHVAGLPPQASASALVGALESAVSMT